SESPVGSNSSSACTCKMGWYGSRGGECTECEAGTYCRMGIKEQCPANKYSPKGSDEVDDCLCVAGYYGHPGSSRGDCVECEAGGWCPGGDMESYQCVPNSMAPVGSTNYTDCVCEPRYHGPDGGNCQYCTPDEYCPGGTDSLDCPSDSGSPAGAMDQRSCQCDGGYEGPPGGPASCTVCGVNTYANKTASTSVGACNACPSNTFSMEESLVISDCTCNAGYTGADGTECTACRAGTYKTETGDGGCIDCGVGTFSSAVAATSANVCSGCQGNASTSAGSNNSMDCSCNPGYYNSDMYEPLFR
ncbi:hypothetical protein T484DRAFT_1647703, partial [Baffinella frigidus]